MHLLGKKVKFPAISPSAITQQPFGWMTVSWKGKIEKKLPQALFIASMLGMSPAAFLLKWGLRKLTKAIWEIWNTGLSWKKKKLVLLPAKPSEKFYKAVTIHFAAKDVLEVYYKYMKEQINVPGHLEKHLWFLVCYW